jgi:acyl-CoA synthetase (NDP forming)
MPGHTDLAVVAVPAKHVPQTLRELGGKNIAAAVAFSSGVAEARRCLRLPIRDALTVDYAPHFQ